MTKILVIEDANELRNDVLEMLHLEGFEAFGAENGVVGVSAARDEHPDLIVCDIMMPELDGYGVLEAIRRNPLTSTIPFIFITAKTDRLDMRHGMVLGADDYLTKPFPVHELLDSIRSQLDKRVKFNQMAEDKLSELRENIITALPHELRTPLNTIIGFSEMLMLECQRLKPDQVADWSQHINIAALRLYRQIENYLFFVRVETSFTNPREIERLHNSIAYAPGNTIEMYVLRKAQNLGRNDNLHLDIQDVEAIICNDTDLGKMVEELVDNAFKFSEPDKPVIVKTAIVNDAFELTVTDYGRGMKPDQIASIGAYMQFERFYYEQQGMGLGLIIVKHLTELYKGEFKVSSEPDTGTVVQIRLRIAQG